MIIECLFKPKDPTQPVEVPISSVVYEFKPNAEGRRLCEVFDEDHIGCFLAIENMYRDAGAVQAAPAPVADDEGEGDGIPKDRTELFASLKALGIPSSATLTTDKLQELLREGLRQAAAARA